MSEPITVYEKATGASYPFPADTELPEGMTLLAPSSKFDTWNEQAGAWEFNSQRWLDSEIRPERNTRLDTADQRVRRYDYQVRAGVATAESAEKIAEVLAYMQVLRDIPETARYETFIWPAVP